MLVLTSTLRAVTRDTRYLAGAILGISILYASCGRQIPEPQTGYAAHREQRKPSSPEERMLVKRIGEAATVLNAIYDDPEVVAEVNAAIATGYYADERVLLADLLYPENSSLYKEARTRQTEAEGPGGSIQWGLFSKKFREAALKILPGDTTGKTTEAVGQQLENGYFTSSGISIYHPYSDEFTLRQRPVIVPATVEADWVDIKDPACPYRHAHNKGRDCRKIRIDDAYAQKKPVHIVGAGAEPAGVTVSAVTLSGTGASSAELIFLGRVKCTRQYDRLISFTGNGGGSELKFIRGEAYITLNNDQQVINTEFDIISVNFRRKDIRKEREKSVYAIWDPNWEPETTEQVFGIYEEDNRGEREFSGAISTQIEHPGGETEVTPVGYSYSVHTQDAVIRQMNWDRSSFFRFNRSGLAGCGLNEGWTWYDCRLPVSYSLPEL